MDKKNEIEIYLVDMITRSKINLRTEKRWRGNPSLKIFKHYRA